MKLSKRFNIALIISITSIPVVLLAKWYFEYKTLAISYLSSDKISSAPPACEFVAGFEVVVLSLVVISLGSIISECYPKFLNWLDKKDYEEQN